MAAAHEVVVRGVPAWVDRDRLLGPGPWTVEPTSGALTAQLTAPAAADLSARLRGLGLGGQPLVVDVRPRLSRPLVRSARTDDARRRRDTTPGFLQPAARTDEEGRWSLTPEALALAMGRRAARLGSQIHVLDATAGCGGNAIGFARAGCRVTAVELSPERAGLCRHNASLYGVAQRIEVVVADAVQAVRSVQADLLFVDPPWGAWDHGRTDLSDLPLLADALTASAGRFATTWAKVPPSFDPSSTPGATAQAWFGAAAGDRQRVKWVLLAWKRG